MVVDISPGCQVLNLLSVFHFITLLRQISLQVRNVVAFVRKHIFFLMPKLIEHRILHCTFSSVELSCQVTAYTLSLHTEIGCWDNNTTYTQVLQALTLLVRMYFSVMIMGKNLAWSHKYAEETVDVSTL